jgi:hypothetical protein
MNDLRIVRVCHSCRSGVTLLYLIVSLQACDHCKAVATGTGASASKVYKAENNLLGLT